MLVKVISQPGMPYDKERRHRWRPSHSLPYSRKIGWIPMHVVSGQRIIYEPKKGIDDKAVLFF